MVRSCDVLLEQLHILRNVYAEQLPAKIGLIAETGSRLLGGASDGEELEALQRMAHNLAGYAATFGFPALTASARILEIYVQSLRDAGT